MSRIVQVGIRSVSQEDHDVVRAEPVRLRVFPAHTVHSEPRDEWVDHAVSSLPDPVYVSFDLDGLDPAVVPGTGTPEPGGLAWWDALTLLREVAMRRRIVGFDVVELIPEPSRVSEFAAARLVMKVLAYLAARE